MIKTEAEAGIRMLAWELRLLGFSTPWWFLALLWAPGPLQGARSMLGLLGLAIGSLVTLWQVALADHEPRGAALAALWFLLGVASMPAAFVLFLMASAMLGAGVSGP